MFTIRGLSCWMYRCQRCRGCFTFQGGVDEPTHDISDNELVAAICAARIVLALGWSCRKERHDAVSAPFSTLLACTGTTIGARRSRAKRIIAQCVDLGVGEDTSNFTYCSVLVDEVMALMFVWVVSLPSCHC